MVATSFHAASAAEAPAPPPTTKPASAPATRPVVRHPAADAATRFRAALKAGDVAAAQREIAPTGTPIPDQAKRLARLAAAVAEDPVPFAVHDVRADGDIAVLLVGGPAAVGDKTFDADRWYLIRQAGQWRVLAKHQEYERPEYGFDAARIEAYQKLDAWAEDRVRQLRLEITGCDC